MKTARKGQIRAKLKLENLTMWTWLFIMTRAEARRWCQNLNLKGRRQNVCIHGWWPEDKWKMEVLVCPSAFWSVPTAVSGNIHERNSCLQTYFCLWSFLADYLVSGSAVGCMCVWACVWLFIHIHTHTSMCMCVCVYIYIYTFIIMYQIIKSMLQCRSNIYFMTKTKINRVGRHHHFPRTLHVPGSISIFHILLHVSLEQSSSR